VSSYPDALGTTGKTTTLETAAQSGNGVSYPSSDRYDGRVVDLDALLAKPPEPIPWRVHDVVADGTLTIVSGESGAGKSWLAQALCTGVARGRAVAGLPCVKGTALYIDAEMGPRMFVDQRLRPTGAKIAEFKYVDAMGLDISTPGDLAWVRGQIEQTGANLVVIDSLRRLTPSKSENDSDDMAPAVAALAKLARDSGAAIVLVHHKGDSEKFFRGSTAIKDQADALFALLRDPDGEHAPRRLRCRGGKGKMRYAPEPPDVYLDISPEEGGVAGSDPPEEPEPQIPIRHAVAQAIKAALPAKTKAEVALKVGRPRNDVTLAAAWKELQDAGEVVEINGVWQLSSYLQTLGTTGKTTPDPGVA
jgi:archaellum biogenesis ATPase FlaH